MKVIERICLAVVAACIIGLTIIAWTAGAKAGEHPPVMISMMPQKCYETKGLEDDLLKNYSEVPTGGGLTTKGDLLRKFASAKAQTFTFVVTRPGGISCIIEAGEGWEDSTEIPGDKT